MQEQNWNDTIDAPTLPLDAAILLGTEDNLDLKKSSSTLKTDVTERRRRIEERLEAKRISLEYEYEDLES
jgi:hypothetical protein|tara:strand:- start:49 stop:258 length:210 start_codon:yes stop_codon:yes gene_type:complete